MATVKVIPNFAVTLNPTFSFWREWGGGVNWFGTVHQPNPKSDYKCCINLKSNLSFRERKGVPHPTSNVTQCSFDNERNKIFRVYIGQGHTDPKSSLQLSIGGGDDWSSMHFCTHLHGV